MTASASASTLMLLHRGSRMTVVSGVALMRGSYGVTVKRAASGFSWGDGKGGRRSHLSAPLLPLVHPFLQPVGPAFRTPSLTCDANWLKLSRKSPASLVAWPS